LPEFLPERVANRRRILSQLPDEAQHNIGYCNVLGAVDRAEHSNTSLNTSTGIVRRLLARMIEHVFRCF
jgi:hypothetical protein